MNCDQVAAPGLGCFPHCNGEGYCTQQVGPLVSPLDIEHEAAA
jgi:hypothetical protein